MVVTGGPLLIRHWMQQVAELRSRHGVRVIWVTSGAIASARIEMKRRQKSARLPEKQALSAIGQPLVMDAYSLALRALGLRAAQVLLTNDDMADAKRSRNLKNVLSTLVKWDAVPVLNENDAVATEEIQFGDNDSLSARVAAMMRADRLVMLTDVDGLFDRDPKRAKGARLIARVAAPRGPRATLSGVDVRGSSKNGTGGMSSKVGAAEVAQRARIDAWLVKGDSPKVLLRLAQGERIGTRFEAAKTRLNKKG